jgi:serine/threonine protein kinase
MLVESRAGNGMAEGEGTLAGSRVGAYQLGKLIGAGQLAEVYQAEHPAIPQPVALKIFMLVAAANTAYMGAMHDIASRVQLLKADYILPIHGFGQEGKLLYLSMPLMYESLRSILQRTGYLPLYRAVALLRQIATGLAAAHAADIIHRDLKPENVLLNVAGQGFVSDFGVGRDLSPESVERRSLGTLSSLIGTPAYMAPEQLRGQPADQPTSGPMSMRSASSSMRCLPARRPTAAIRSTMSRRRRSPPPPATLVPTHPITGPLNTPFPTATPKPTSPPAPRPTATHVPVPTATATATISPTPTDTPTP